MRFFETILSSILLSAVAESAAIATIPQVGSIVAVADKAIIPAGSPNGVYEHIINVEGKVETIFLGTANATTSELTSRGTENIQKRALELYCVRESNVNLDQSDYRFAIEGLINTCGGGRSFKRSLSTYWGSVVAYVCESGNGNSCDRSSYATHNGALDSECGYARSAWWAIPEWKVSGGHTHADTGFC